ncbi:hypothetical protein FGE12_23520 [Aggregicoccus sp. 17bor-14]|uniref:hypothetical protein n=1 Tax=Myxococcaceae TaxID=31 RepID=UPI00129C61F8|nr:MULTISPECIES: hypothetical protein [Myxococcaceae]MBF5045396.1 hypothetical protein [Simulacricoccus sp. 17bor-14]MRI91137.1 hypothetical protein [Aggregicoccus sp. 17bor-14]
MPRPFRTALLRSLLPALALGLAACGGGDSGSSDPGDEHVHAGSATGATCDSSLTYANFGQGFMTAYCTSCHDAHLQGPARSDAPADHNYDTLAGVQKWKSEIELFAAAGPQATNTQMPPSRPTPDLAARQKLGAWLACGAP